MKESEYILVTALRSTRDATVIMRDTMPIRSFTGEMRMNIFRALASATEAMEADVKAIDLEHDCEGH